MNSMEPRTIVILGKGGSGKDTQLALLKEKLVPCITIITGDLFRALAAQPTAIGRRVKRTDQEGGLQPAWAAQYVWMRVLVEQLTGAQHILCSGIARRLEEAKSLDDVIGWLERPLPEALLIDISDEEAKKRLMLRKRHDDTEEAIDERLSWFKKDVGPVIDYYEQHERLYRVDGIGTVSEVFDRIKAALAIT
jgi:adenylate kinase